MIADTGFVFLQLKHPAASGPIALGIVVQETLRVEAESIRALLLANSRCGNLHENGRDPS